MTQSQFPTQKLPLTSHGLGVQTSATSAPGKAGGSGIASGQSTPLATETIASEPFSFVGQSPKPVMDDMLAMRQIMEPDKQAISFDPPIVPEFRDLLVLLADNVNDRNQRDSTLDDVQSHYQQVRNEIVERIKALDAPIHGADMQATKAALTQRELLRASLAKVHAEMDLVEYYRGLPS